MPISPAGQVLPTRPKRKQTWSHWLIARKRIARPDYPISPLCNKASPGQLSGNTRAAVAFEKAKPLEIVELDLEGPKHGEVLVEIKATVIY